MFKVGDEIKIINPECKMYGFYGTITSKMDGFYTVSFGADVRYWYENEDLERINDMNISERLSEVIKENQNLKQQLSEQNIKLNKIQADLKRESKDKQGVSDEEFGEAIKHFSIIDEDKRYEIWGLINCFDLFAQTSLSEFVNKYKEYKDKQNEIKVGDEVYYLDHNYKSIVTCVEDGVAVMITNNGKWSTCNTEELHKTGKHYDIESILNGLKEGD